MKIPSYPTQHITLFFKITWHLKMKVIANTIKIIQLSFCMCVTMSCEKFWTDFDIQVALFKIQALKYTRFERFWGVAGMGTQERQSSTERSEPWYERQHKCTPWESLYDEQKNIKLFSSMSPNQNSKRQLLQTIGTSLWLSHYSSGQLKAHSNKQDWFNDSEDLPRPHQWC